MQCLISIRDERDEDRENHINEESNEDVKVDLGEDISSSGFLGHLAVSGKHVVSIDEREETF